MLKAAVIGCGGRGQAHAHGYQASDQVESIAFVDAHKPTAELRADEFGASKVYEDYNEMLKKESPDVVSICLWTGLHYDAVMACVDAKVKLINCEKPMAPTWGEAKGMHEACEQAGILMTYSHQTRYGPSFKKVRALVQDGAIGELIRIEGCGANLFDLGTHRFDRMFFYRMDEPAAWVMGQVDCSDDRTVFDVPVETYGLSLVGWEDGVTGLLATGLQNPVQDRLIGTEGMIENSTRGEVRLLRQGSADWEIPDLQPVKIPGRETALYILDAINWLETGEESLTSSRRTLGGTEVIFATYESARRRARVELPLDIEDSPLLSMLESGEIIIPDYVARLSEKEVSEGFELLFNGKDLSGLSIVGPEEAWEVNRGLLVCNGAGEERGWIRPEKKYTDFVIRLEYRIEKRGNSGVFVRTSEEGRPAYQGMEIQLLDDRRSEIRNTSNGGIYDAVAPKSDASRPAGNWNTVEVSCEGPTVRVLMNGREVVNCNTAEHQDLKDRLQSGYVGLQNHHCKIDFRNVRIRVL